MMQNRIVGLAAAAVTGEGNAGLYHSPLAYLRPGLRKMMFHAAVLSRVRQAVHMKNPVTGCGILWMVLRIHLLDRFPG